MSSSPGERTIGVFRSGVQSAVISGADSKPLQESTTDFLLLSGSRRVSSFRANFYGKTTKNGVLTVKFRTDAAGEPTSGTSRGEPVMQVVLHGCPTIDFNVPVGTDLSNPPIPLVPEAAPPANTMPATISGQVTSAGSNPVADVTLSAFQQAVPMGGSARQVTVPVFNSMNQPPVVTTTPTPTPTTPACPMNTDCFNYSLQIPGSNPQVGTFSGGSITYAAPAAPPVMYSLNGMAPSC